MGGFGESVASLFLPELCRKGDAQNEAQASQVGLGALASALSMGTSLSEGRDAYHAVRVAYLTARITGVLELPENEARPAVFGALLHDVGVPVLGPELADAIDYLDTEVWALLPREPLERIAATTGRRPARIQALLSSHTRRGMQIVEGLPTPKGTDQVVFSHHECWNGSGFPHGASGNDTSVAARVVAFADAIDARARGRYGEPAAQEFLQEFARSESGQMFDPEVAGVLAELAKDDRFWSDLGTGNPGDALWRVFEDEPLTNGRLRDTLWSVAEIADARSRYRAAHSPGVASYAQLLAAEMGYRGKEVDVLRRAALLHDIGLLGVPSTVLDKTGELTESEWQYVRRHSGYTRDILSNVTGLTTEPRIAGEHHEWVNGQGYPDGLSGVGISAMGRILAVADSYEALTSDRPWRRSLEPDEALKLMQTGSRTKYDPSILEAMYTVVEEFVLAPTTLTVEAGGEKPTIRKAA